MEVLMEVPKNAFKYICTVMQNLPIVWPNRYLELASTNKKMIGLLGKKKNLKISPFSDCFEGVIRVIFRMLHVWKVLLHGATLHAA